MFKVSYDIDLILCHGVINFILPSTGYYNVKNNYDALVTVCIIYQRMSPLQCG